MRRRITLGAGVVLAAAALWLAAWLQPRIAARERTRVELRLVDDRDRPIERALADFRTASGETLAVYELAWGWRPTSEPAASDGWGRRVARVHWIAFGCELDAPIAAEVETHGSRFGVFSPHPNPLTRVYVLGGKHRCPAARRPTERGLGLDRLIGDLSAGEPWSHAAVDELIRIGPAAAAALPRLVELLGSAESTYLRIGAARALGSMGAVAAAAVPSLAPLLGDPEAGVRRTAATALEDIGAQAPGVVTALASAARRDPDFRVQQHIVRILGRMGPDAREAEAALVALLEDAAEEDAVRRAAFAALGSLDSPGALDAQKRYAAEHPILW